jgi:tetratricopeptide (TPR) repeat protein
MSLAAVQLSRGRPADAIPHARQAVDILERLSSERGQDLHGAAELLSAQTNLALAHQSIQQVAEAKAVYSGAFKTAERLRNAEPNNPHHSAAMAALCLNRGNIDLHGGEPRESLAWFDRAIAAADHALSINSRYADAKLWKLNAHGARAQAYGLLQDYVAAVADWDRVVELSAANELQLHRLLRLTALARAGEYARTHAEAAALSQIVSDAPSLQHIAEACAAAVTRWRSRSAQDSEEHRETIAAIADRGADCLRRAFQAVNGSDKLALAWEVLKNPEMKNLHITASDAKQKTGSELVGGSPPQ